VTVKLDQLTVIDLPTAAFDPSPLISAAAPALPG